MAPAPAVGLLEVTLQQDRRATAANATKVCASVFPTSNTTSISIDFGCVLDPPRTAVAGAGCHEGHHGLSVAHGDADAQTLLPLGCGDETLAVNIRLSAVHVLGDMSKPE